MNVSKYLSFFFNVALVLAAASAVSAAQSQSDERSPANVQGNWTIYARNFKGTTDTKSVRIVQEGNQLKGHFKGPYQSGGIEGTINGQHIVFRTKTRDVLTFRGMVSGDTIRGTFGNHGRTGEFEATRLNR